VAVVRVEPERRIEQLRHGRQHPLAREIEIMGEPTLAHEEAHELLGCFDVAAVLERQSREKAVLDREALAAWAERPFERRGVLVVVLGPLMLECVGNGERSFTVMTTAWARNASLLAKFSQVTESSGVQPFR
jgi:hypothetical protein